ncbi:TIGR02449 family protein [Spiribacter vilamensis]|uniref:Cell division protein ZapB n=1 Tax=Spiribacter vilamensis TaxID=531306 RepID=A0A4Q8D2F4_9GAMM|nr:cell division protein ZapB [Spiribacter vilamensis]TVO61455.1 TIGR02449 family protein [Spiribacter vilamensis]
MGQVVDSVNEQADRLERRVERLIQLCEQLRDENRVLLRTQESLNAERAALLEKNETARARIEAMIGRLKALEQDG